MDSAATVPDMTSGERFSRCRRCSISCCFEVSRYSWYRNAGGKKKEVIENVLASSQIKNGILKITIKQRVHSLLHFGPEPWLSDTIGSHINFLTLLNFWLVATSGLYWSRGYWYSLYTLVPNLQWCPIIGIKLRALAKSLRVFCG